VGGDTFSFVLRIWHEALDDQGRIAAWRGSIEEVGDGERLYFYDLDEVIRYIRRRAGIGNRGQPPARAAGEASRGQA
jgi:hypothetical protein